MGEKHISMPCTKMGEKHILMPCTKMAVGNEIPIVPIGWVKIVPERSG